MAEQQGKTGQYCLWISGVLLLICGLGCCVSAYAAVPAISNALNTACDSMADVANCLPCEDVCEDVFEEATKDLPAGSADTQEAKDTREQCLKDCANTGDQFNREVCLVDLKKSAGCTCTKTDDSASCDCSGTQLEQIQGLWELVCMALGAVGLIGAVFFTGLPALVAGTRYNGCVNACCFSVCSGIFSLVFIGMGAGFILVGAAVNGPVGDDLKADCSSGVAGEMSSDVESTGSESMDAAVDDLVDCAAESFCKGIIAIVQDVGNMSVQVALHFPPNSPVSVPICLADHILQSCAHSPACQLLRALDLIYRGAPQIGSTCRSESPTLLLASRCSSAATSDAAASLASPSPTPRLKLEEEKGRPSRPFRLPFCVSRAIWLTTHARRRALQTCSHPHARTQAHE